MKVFLLNGAGSPEEFTFKIRDVLMAQLTAQGRQVEVIDACTASIRPCIGCGACAFKTPGRCVLSDDGTKIARMQAQSDVMIILSATAKRAFERTMPNVHPYFVTYNGELHHQVRYARRPFMMFIGWQSEPDNAGCRIFARYAERSAVNFQTRHSATVIVGRPEQSELESRLATALNSGLVNT